jgi:hypothetical protein
MVILRLLSIYLAQKDNVYFALKIYNHGEVHLKAFKN